MEKPDKKTIEKIKAYLEKNLSKKRFAHSMNVAAAAKKLACKYGEDRDIAYFAGMAHDIAKELCREKQYELAKGCPFDVSEIELSSAPLLHAPAGAQLLSKKFGITDTEILKAVRYHTVACGSMSRLLQIVYIADLIAADREYKDVKKIRKFAAQGLEKAMLEALRFSVCDSVQKGNTIPLSTIAAYNEFAVRLKENKKEQN